ncbi:MAG: FKBP-type peptidyl-prolyl cis-trans isomerase [Fluviicola sp.]|nr:FKBP-type peptidyl-prolyl cis-trans isomerase [Fluviicola sp.]
MKYLLLILTVAFLASCSTYSDDEKGSFDEKIQSYLSEKGIDAEKSSSGVYYKIIEQGEGKKVKFKDVISFKYRGELLNGVVFDEKKEPIDYQLNQLIACWKEVILQLNEGGKAFLISPPQQAYGNHELEDIPQNSILVFNLEVVEVK